MDKEKINKVVDSRQMDNKQKYFLVVSEEGCVMEFWANSYLDLVGIVSIYDDEEKPYKVSIIVDVTEKHLYDVVHLQNN